MNASLGMNICEVLIEELIIPPTFEEILKCDSGACTIFTADCCSAVLCKANPICTFWDKVEKTAEVVLHPGDTYCRTNMTPREYLERLKNGALSDAGAGIAQVIPAGLGILWNFDIQVLAAVGRPTPSYAKDLIRKLTEPVYDNGDTGFKYSDMDEVTIVSSDFPTAKYYVFGDRRAITLGPVIILESDLYNALFNSSNGGVSYSEFLTDTAVTHSYIDAIDTMIHELVHVKQHRELGQNSFQIQYLASALRDEPSPFEVEAYEYHIGLAQLQGGRWCSQMKGKHNDRIATFDLSLPLSTCP